MVLAGASPHSNQGLFSDHYLEHYLPPLTPDEAQDAQRLRDEIAQLLTKAVAQAAGKKEANVEHVLIRPALAKLGFVLEPQPPLPTAEAALAPDYALFADDEQKATAGKHYRKPEYFAHVLALAEAKKWGLSLGATQAKKPRARPTHPGAQLRQYLAESGVRWGILTNGQVWRLYEQDASRGGQRFYEVDLFALSRQADPDAWRYFYQFFRRQAFERDPEGRCVLDKWLASSRDYALGLTKRLRDNVYEALRCLMDGFFAHEDNGLHWDSDAECVHDACLVLLYRLLFVLYAEARKLLPIDDSRTYLERYSLQQRKHEIADRLERGNGYDRFGTGLWNWLQNDLFRLVDKGDARMGVAEYNGGLFRVDADHWPLHGRDVRLADCFVAQAIDLLGRDQDPDVGAKAFVDYSELGVRELGSIYEGLLEMKPHLATEPMIEVKRAGKDKGPSIIPDAEATPEQRQWNQKPRNKAARYEPGQVYLLTDRGERKATGSYYTPEYIVNYIVEHTLDPLLTQCAAAVARGRPAVERKIKRLEKAIAERRGRANEAANRRAIEAAALELLEPYFQLKVLDPAMGSGHFLVGAAEFLTDAILTDPNRIPPPEPNGEDEALYYKRRVVERCLYGVDLNPLAAELAKLSLWLHTVQKDRALSFLDHHLRCGNSLIGARVDGDLCREPPILDKRGRQINKDSKQPILGFYDTLRSRHLENFLSVLSEIEGTPTINAESEGRKNLLYKTLDELREPYRQVANLWVSPYFAPPVSLISVTRDPDMPPPITADQFHQAVEGLAAGTQSQQWAAVVERPWFQVAQKIAAERRFFNWELEFPEIWYERGRRKENPGFDAVIGNPPYGPSGARDYLSHRYPMASQNGDLFVAFLESGLRLARRGGVMAWIIPVMWQTGLNYSRLRDVLLSEASFLRIVNLPFDVFPDAYVDTGIAAIRLEPPGSGLIVRTYAFPKTKTVDSLGGITYHEVEQHRWRDNRGTILVNAARMEVLLKLESALLCVPLGSMTESCRGILAGDEHVSEKCCGAAWKPLFTGEMGRYGHASASFFVLYGEQLPERPKSFDMFTGERMLVRRLVSRQDRLMATISADVFVNKKDVYVFKPLATRWHVQALLALVNSTLMSFAYLERDVAAAKDDFRQTTLDGLRGLPIRRIHFTTPATERTEMLRELKRTYSRWVAAQPRQTKAILARVEELLPRDEGGRFLAFKPGATGGEEKSDVVHDFLAHLAEQMTQMHKDRQAETRRFLEWLETEIHHKVDDLRLKTKIAAYHEGDAEALLDALKANDKALDRVAHRSAFQSDLRREFENSLSVLGPLKARIAATDWLIDQVVYRLYGLTQEEVAIVEGGGGATNLH